MDGWKERDMEPAQWNAPVPGYVLEAEREIDRAPWAEDEHEDLIDREGE